MVQLHSSQCKMLFPTRKVFLLTRLALTGIIKRLYFSWIKWHPVANVSEVKLFTVQNYLYNKRRTFSALWSVSFLLFLNNQNNVLFCFLIDFNPIFFNLNWSIMLKLLFLFIHALTYNRLYVNVNISSFSSFASFSSLNKKILIAEPPRSNFVTYLICFYFNISCII